MRYLILLPVLAALPQDPPRLPDRWVGAFYRATWDSSSGEGMSRAGGGDGLVDHPESFTDFSYKSPAWHRRNLEEMGAAGLDVALCEFAHNADAVKALVQALEQCGQERKKIPRVAPAVTDPAAAASFLKSIPAEFRAAMDGRAIVWGLPSKDAKPIDSTEIVTLGDAAWKPVIPAVIGGAFDGPRDMQAVTLGPGFKDGSSRLRGRDEGLWYEKSWYAALRIKPRVVAIESWNRFDEGSTICPTREHGRGWIDKTRKYVDSFARGHEIAKPKGKYTSAVGVSYHLKFDPPSEGLRPLTTATGPFDVVTLAGQSFLMAKPVRGQEMRYLAFDIDDSYAYYERREYEVQIQVLDKGPGDMAIEYDAGRNQVRRTEPYYFTDSGGWATATFKLPDALFANRQEGGSDFRLVAKGRGLSVRWVQVRAK